MSFQKKHFLFFFLLFNPLWLTSQASLNIAERPSTPATQLVNEPNLDGGGTRFSNNVSLNLRFSDKFNTEFGIQHNDINLPNGDFTTDIFRARLSYSFTPSIFTQSLIQYNSVAGIWSANIRFGWLQQANTGLFVVYNEIRGGTGIVNRSFILKYSRVFDVLK